MKLYSVHLCGFGCKECLDIDMWAEDSIKAEEYALDYFSGYKAARTQSEMGEDGDWIDYE